MIERLNTIGSSTLALAALVGALAGWANGRAVAGEADAGLTMKPTQAIVLEAGPKRIIGVFVVTDGQCNFSATVSETFREDPGEIRIQATLSPGAASRIDAGNGHAFQFSCKASAQTMTATKLGESAAFAGAERSWASAGPSPRILEMQRAAGI